MDGPVGDELHHRVFADVNDPQFLSSFQNGLRVSSTFRNFHIAPGNYGENGTQDDVIAKVSGVNLSAVLAGHGTAMQLFADKEIRPYDLTTPQGSAKTLICSAAICSAKLNFALNVGARYGFVPFADATPFRDLLSAKYARAVASSASRKNRVQVTDLSFALFDELVSPERLGKLTLVDVASYRKASASAREEFLEHLSIVQARQPDVGIDDDYSVAVTKVIKTELVPAAKIFKAKLQGIEETMFGALSKGVVGYIGAGSALNFFGDLSWEKVVALGGMAGTYVATAAIDGLVAKRAAKRECAVSYILSLDK
jgi:hypothetical protein